MWEGNHELPLDGVIFALLTMEEHFQQLVEAGEDQGG